MSGIDMIVITMIVADDSILKVSTVHCLRKTGASLEAAVPEAGNTRCRPIILTSLTMILAGIGGIFMGTLASLFLFHFFQEILKKSMNRIFLLLPFFLSPILLSGQEDPYSHIEVWGIADSARADFFGLHEERELPICAASLKTLGYPNGNRILIDNGKEILTIRDFPDLPWEDQFTPKRPFRASGMWNKLLALDMFSLESQLTHQYYRAYLAKDSSRFTQLHRENQDRLGLYGFDADEQKMKWYCEMLSRRSQEISLEEVMEVLYFADSSSTKIKIAAAFLLPALIQTDEEALDLLPLLFDPEAYRIQHLLRYYFLLPEKQVDWTPALPTLAIALTHPDPLIVMDLVEILSHTGFNPELAPEILSRGAITFQEILRSDVALSWQDEVMSFLEDMHIIHSETTPEETINILDSYRQE